MRIDHRVVFVDRYGMKVEKPSGRKKLYALVYSKSKGELLGVFNWIGKSKTPIMRRFSPKFQNFLQMDRLRPPGPFEEVIYGLNAFEFEVDPSRGIKDEFRKKALDAAKQIVKLANKNGSCQFSVRGRGTGKDYDLTLETPVASIPRGETPESVAYDMALLFWQSMQLFNVRTSPKPMAGRTRSKMPLVRRMHVEIRIWPRERFIEGV